MGEFDRCNVIEQRFNLFSASCPKSRPFAQRTSVGADVLYFCCPTRQFIQPVEGLDQDNQCALCTVTATSNCDNFVRKFF